MLTLSPEYAMDVRASGKRPSVFTGISWNCARDAGTTLGNWSREGWSFEKDPTGFKGKLL